MSASSRTAAQLWPRQLSGTHGPQADTELVMGLYPSVGHPGQLREPLWDQEGVLDGRVRLLHEPQWGGLRGVLGGST